MLLSLVFVFWSPGLELYKPFPFSDQQLTIGTHVYFVFEHLFIVAILYLWLFECVNYSRDYVRMFLFLQIGDFADYLLRYSEPFLKVYEFWISYNTIQFVLFGVFIVYKAWKE